MQLAFTTVDEFHALLEQAGEGLDYREVWPRLFPVANCPPELMRKLVADIVTSDERFAWESDVHVGLAQWRARRRDLADVAFTVVDLETTGATPGFAKITEIGAVRLECGEEVGRFSTLVNPGVAIPAMITGITGIDDELVADAPHIDEALPRFVEFSRDSVLVAHNAQFDLSFLDYELGRLERRTFPRPALDTLRLARKLCPQQRCSLSALSYRFDTQVKPVHRALQDAQATGELLLLFLSWLQEQGMSTLEEVARFCEPGARRNYHKISLTEGLPNGPGVYIMRDAKGHALYVGKAENLKRRTRDHFLQRQAYHARQALELLERFDVVQTGSEFAALLLEGRLIAKHKPLYNSHGTRASSYHYVKLSADEYPRLYATPNLRDDGSYYAGPFRKATLARRFVDCVNGVYPLRTCAHMPGNRAARRRPRLPARRDGLLPCALPPPSERRVRRDRGRRAARAGGPRRRPGQAPAGAAGHARAGPGLRAGRPPAEAARGAGARAAQRQASAGRAAHGRRARLPHPAAGLGGALGRPRGRRGAGARGRPRRLRRGSRTRLPRRRHRGPGAAPAPPRPPHRRDAPRARLDRATPRGRQRAGPAGARGGPRPSAGRRGRAARPRAPVLRPGARRRARPPPSTSPRKPRAPAPTT